MTDQFSTTLGKGVGIILVQKDEEIERWRLHASRWEEVARNLGMILSAVPEQSDAFRRVCAAHEVTA